MKHWKRFSILALVAFGLFALGRSHPAQAVDVQGGVVGEGTNKSIRTFVVNPAAGGNAVGGGMNSISTFPANTYIIGFKIIATAANSNFDLYDAATIGGSSVATVQSQVIDELAEVSANGTALQIWPHPYKIKTALSVGIRNCVGIVYYY